MGGVSTSQSAVLRDSDLNNASYDLRSWQGLTEVLKDAKASLRNPEVYAEFRNLVLAYAKEGGDPALKQKIDAIIETFKSQSKDAENSLIIQEKNSETKEKFALGGRRMQPRFLPTTRFTRAEPIPVVPESKPASARINTSPLPPPPPQVRSSEEKMQDAPVNLAQNEKVEEKGAVESVRAVEQGIRTLEEYKNRITEIKRIVREKVGNPAALIDTHNEIGKKYMVALLNALKATSGGGTMGADSAMRTLEEAFVAITKNSDSQQSTTANKTDGSKATISTPISKSTDTASSTSQIRDEHKPTETSIPAKETVQTEPVVRSVEAQKPIFPPLKAKAQVNTHANPSNPESKAIPKAKQFEESIFASDTDFAKSMHMDVEESEHKQEFKDSDAVVTSVLKKQAIGHSPREVLLSALDDDETPVTVSDDTKSTFREKNNEIEDEEDSGAIPAQTKYAHKGVAAQSLEEVKQEYNIDPKDVALRQSELFTPEITEALHELLHEWRVFSSSGLFGTGPGGSEHPLYIQLAPLSMGEVIAGRWEGTNPKTQKAIKEYVDAWRHEQGIAYTINETFEHYLRRVLQKILKRQKQNIGM